MGYGGLRIQSYRSGLPKWVLVSYGLRVTTVGYGGLRIQSSRSVLPKRVTGGLWWVKDSELPEVGYRNGLWWVKDSELPKLDMVC